MPFSAFMISAATFEFFATDEFRRGLLFGAAACCSALVIGLTWRRFRPAPAPVGGFFVLAALLAMPVTRALPGEVWQAMAMLAGGGLLFPWARRVPFLPAILAAPGAWWLTQRVEVPGSAWVPWFLAAAVVFGAPLAASFDRRHADRGLGPVFIAVTVAGAFATLPDTEEALVLLGAVVLVALLAWPWPLVSFGAWGVYPLVGALAWVAAWGGRGREGAVVGAMAGLGVMLAEPLARAIGGRTLLDRLPAGWWSGPVAAALQAAVVFGTARVAGLRSSPVAAGIIAAVVVAGVGVVVVVGKRFAALRRSSSD